MRISKKTSIDFSNLNYLSESAYNSSKWNLGKGLIANNGAMGIDSFTIENRSIDDVLPTTSYTTPPTAVAIRTEIDSNSTKLDVAVSTRLATASYTAPDNATISSIQTEVNSHPTLVEIEASTVLAKEATIPTVGEIRTELTPELTIITTNLDVPVSSVGSGGGLTTEEHDKLMGITGGGGYAVSQGLDAQDKKYLKETHEKVLQLENTDISGIESQLNEISSQNDIAKDNIIDRIEEVENEVCSDIVRAKSELKKDNVATRNLVRQKTKKINEKLDKDEKEEDEGNEVLELLKELKEESDDKELIDFLDDVESKDIETLLT